jgi:DNA-binding protein HU-beta
MFLLPNERLDPLMANEKTSIVEIRNNVADVTGQHPKVVKAVLDAYHAEIVKSLAAKKDVSVNDFFTFKATVIGERSGRNPQTGEDITIPAHWGARAKASGSVKDKLKGVRVTKADLKNAGK